MGYRSSLHLIDVKIKPESVQLFERIRTGKVRVRSKLRFLLERVVLDAGGFLAFKPSDDGLDPYEPDADDGTTPSLEGKWYKVDERFGAWLKQHSEKGGRIVLHSREADGSAWGWEFDGRGRMRSLGLRRIGKWELGTWPQKARVFCR